MGNMICCANDAEGIVDSSDLLNDKKPKLFGAKLNNLNNESSDESNEEDHPLEGKLVHIS